MKQSVFLGAVAAAGLVAGFASAGTLDDVKARDQLVCGVNIGLTGFGAPDANGNYQGFDVALCKALAAAILKDANKVKYVGTSGETRFTALASREVDVLIRNSTWTYSRDTDLKFDFVAVNYYDGQGFMVKKELAVSSAKELSRAKICIPGEPHLTDYFTYNNIAYTAVAVSDDTEGRRQYVAGACDAYTTDISSLAAIRATLPDRDNHIILPEIVSKEPLGPLVRHGDNNWGDIIRWTFYALVAAEEYGVTSANVEETASSSHDPEVRRLLGVEGDLGAMMGLDKDWAKRAIAAQGNYGEIFEANIGAATPIGLARGLNAQWTQGGLLYAPPFR